MNNTKTTTTTLTVLVLATAGTLCAQESSSFFTGEERTAYSAETSYSGKSHISKGGTSLGEIDTFHQSFSYLHTWQRTDQHGFSVGVAGQRFGFDVPDNSTLPERLGSIALRLGESWRFSDQWTARIEIQPGIYSDFEDFSGGDFNVPFALGVAYSIRPNLQLLGGLGVNFRSKYPVFGGIGVRWGFAEGWTLLLGAPRTRIEYGVNERLTAFVGGDVKGGTFRVARDFGSKSGRRDLNDEDVDYREIRVGTGRATSSTIISHWKEMRAG